jgi:LysM repeat protein
MGITKTINESNRIPVIKDHILTLIVFLLFLTHGFGQDNTSGITRSNIVEQYNGKPVYIHFVKPGQTLYAISKAYGVTPEEIRLINTQLIDDNLKPNQIIKIPFAGIGIGDKSEQAASDASAKYVYHTVLPKETLYSLAREYRTTVDEIKELNPILNEQGLQVGQELKLPASDAVHEGSMFSGSTTPWQHAEQDTTKEYIEYRVQPKETLFGLSRHYHVAIDELISLNPELVNGLKAGQIIMIPDYRAHYRNYVTAGKDTLVYYIVRKTKKNQLPLSVAHEYGVSLDELYLLNPELDDLIARREPVKIPVRDTAAYPDVEAGTLYITTYKPPAPEETATGEPRECDAFVYRGEIYNIALMIPFYLEDMDEISGTDTTAGEVGADFKPFKFIQFYEGALLAIDSMARQGLHAKIYVFDVDETPLKTNKVLADPMLKKMNLIIGPFFRRSFSRVADFARDHHIKIVNPFTTSDEILDDAPLVFKVQPSWRSQIKLLVEHLLSDYPDANYIITRQNAYLQKSDLDYLKKQLFNGLLQRCYNDSLRVKNYLKDVNYDNDSINGLRNNVSPIRPNIVISLSDDRLFIIKLISNLITMRDYYDITLVGIPQWMTFDLDVAYLMNLNLHLFSDSFVDYTNNDVRDFIIKFRQRFRAEPKANKYAFIGFDVTYFFLSAFRTYGDDFEKCIPYLHIRGLAGDFHFTRQKGKGFENDYVDIYRLDNYQMIRDN